jgi:eukaryotic-like serine/threonine-protein kinase
MDTTVADPLLGQLLDGRYRVDTRIARGGMATVYVATDTRLDRTVALKIMHASLASDDEFVHRFIGEAKTVARLSHPNVVAVFDQGSARQGGVEQLFLAMEYVPGQTLRHLLTGHGRLDPAEALDIFVPVLAGLGAAHRAGLVHRDVKPENVLLTPERRVKVADFGLARAVSSATRHTKTGMLIGTVAYVAPEQVTHSVIDARTDVYAAGIMLFEMLTGQQPHMADSPLGVAYKHVNEAVPPPSSLVPELPAPFDALIALAASRDPAQRPADASQLLRAVSEVRQQLPAGTAFSPQPGPTATRQPGTAPYGLDSPAPAGGPAHPPPPGFGTHPDSPPHDSGVPHPGGPGPGVLYPGASYADGPPSAGAGQDDLHTLLPPVQMAGPNHTLMVPQDQRGAPPYRRTGIRLHRVAIVAGAVAAALVIGLVAWFQLSGRFVPVPDVRNMTTTAATTQLRDAGFSVRLGRPEPNNKVTKGDVAITVPAVGQRMPRTGTITLIPSAGPRMISVPGVSGKTLTGAKIALRLAGLTPGAVTHQVSDAVPKGSVVTTQPAAGTSWPQPKPVRIVVSAGPGLPDFAGQQKAAAELWLKLHQLSWNEQPDTGSSQPAGVITKQSPAPDTAMQAGAETVTLYISTGPQMVPIPQVTGMQMKDARKALQQAGFHVNALGNGTVIAEAPKGQAPRGSAITLWAMNIPGLGGGGGGPGGGPGGGAAPGAGGDGGQ